MSPNKYTPVMQKALEFWKSIVLKPVFIRHSTQEDIARTNFQVRRMIIANQRYGKMKLYRTMKEFLNG